MKAAILARVSTSEQAVADRHSLPVQQQFMQEYAARRGWTVVRVFEIPGESAFRWNVFERPQFAAVLEAAARHEFEAIIVYDVSRVARNQAVLHETRRRLRELGMQLWSASGDYDVVADGMRAGMEGIISEQSSEDHSRRVRHAYTRRHEIGLPTGDIPFGYRKGDGPVAPPVVEPFEAEAIAGLFRDYIAGAGYSELADRLNAMGLRPRSKRGRTAFSISTVQSLIQNDFYAGFVRHGESRRPGLHEAIINEELWLAAQARPERHGVKTRSPRFLTGVVGCYHCSGPVWYTLSGRHGRVGYYREAAKTRRQVCSEAGRIWRAEDVEGQITRAIESMGMDADWLAAVDREARIVATPAAAHERAELQEKKRRLSEVYIAGDMDAREYQQRRHVLEMQLANLPAEDVGRGDVGPRFEALGQAWGLADVGERREIVRTIFEWVRLDWQAREVRLQPWPEFQRAIAHRRAWCVGYTPERTRRYGQHTPIVAASELAA